MVTEVIHEYDILEKVGRGAVYDAGDGSKENCVGLIVEDDHHRSCWKIRRVSPVHTPKNDNMVSFSFSLSLSLSFFLSLKHCTLDLWCLVPLDQARSCRYETG